MLLTHNKFKAMIQKALFLFPLYNDGDLSKQTNETECDNTLILFDTYSVENSTKDDIFKV